MPVPLPLTSLLVGALLGLAGCAGQMPEADGPRSRVARVATLPSLSEADRSFVLEAASAVLYEVEVSKLAEARTQNPLIKAYAGLLAKDHGAARAELDQLAGARGLTLPEAALPEQRSLIDAMKALPPEEFNQRFVQQVGIEGHRKGILLYQAMVAKAADASLKAWAMRMLVLLREHLAAAQRLPATTHARAPLAAAGRSV